MHLIALRMCAALVVLAPFTATHAQEVKTRDFSGWMQSYDNLVYMEDRNAWLFTNEERRGTYTAVMLGDINVYGSNVAENPDIATQASDYLRDGIIKIFREERVYADAPGPDVVKLSMAITGAEKSVESMKPRDVIPVAAVFRGAKAATGNLETYIDVMFEGEAVDSVSGERVMAIVTRDYGETDKKSGDDFEFEDLLPTLDRWLAQYRNTLRSYLAVRQ
jgi:hypothetical protein